MPWAYLGSLLLFSLRVPCVLDDHAAATLETAAGGAGNSTQLAVPTGIRLCAEAG